MPVKKNAAQSPLVAFTFLCDIEGCGTPRIERTGPSYDETRSAWAMARSAGWHLEKDSESGQGRTRRTKWRVLCPACNTPNWMQTPE